MAVLPILSALTGFFKVTSVSEKPNIDSAVEKAHYKLTAALLFACSTLVTATSLFGEPISCVADRSISEHVMNSYCWITHTFTFPEIAGQTPGVHSAYPGVYDFVDDSNEIRYHSYYQWVPFVLFFQGLMFYLPHWIWKTWEGNRINMITEGMRGATFGTEEEKSSARLQLVQYLVKTLNKHNIYATGYYSYQILNFLVAYSNAFLINSFLGGVFWTYGLRVLEFFEMDQETRNDPMVAVFPKATKCTFHKYGPSGTIMTYDALCILAMNVLNEKIYAFLWFWLAILIIFSGLGLIYATVLVTIAPSRKLFFLYRFKFGTLHSISALNKKLQVGDFLLLFLISKNLNTMEYNMVLDDLCVALHIDDDLPTDSGTLELAVQKNDKLLKKRTETQA